MIIKDAKFVISNSDVRKCPEGDTPEYAFIGRSNVGKSSLINMLTGRKGLAMTSSTPGKTMLINHFLVNDSWYIVDLPGYGYARRGKDAREKLRTMIDSYVLHRHQMTNLFVLVDIRHKPQAIDLEFINFLGENGIPFSIVFTKADKLGPIAGKRWWRHTRRNSRNFGKNCRRYSSLQAPTSAAAKSCSTTLKVSTNHSDKLWQTTIQNKNLQRR